MMRIGPRLVSRRSATGGFACATVESQDGWWIPQFHRGTGGCPCSHGSWCFSGPCPGFYHRSNRARRSAPIGGGGDFLRVHSWRATGTGSSGSALGDPCGLNPSVSADSYGVRCDLAPGQDFEECSQTLRLSAPGGSCRQPALRASTAGSVSTYLWLTCFFGLLPPFMAPLSFGRCTCHASIPSRFGAQRSMVGCGLDRGHWASLTRLLNGGCTDAQL